MFKIKKFINPIKPFFELNSLKQKRISINNKMVNMWIIKVLLVELILIIIVIMLVK